jgi:hypothetical protein
VYGRGKCFGPGGISPGRRNSRCRPRNRGTVEYVLSTLSPLSIDRFQGRRSPECRGKGFPVVLSALPVLSLWPALLCASMAGAGKRNRLKHSIGLPRTRRVAGADCQELFVDGAGDGSCPLDLQGLVPLVAGEATAEIVGVCQHEHELAIKVSLGRRPLEGVLREKHVSALPCQPGGIDGPFQFRRGERV